MIWNIIPGYEDHEISAYGDVRRILDRNGNPLAKPKPKKASLMNNGYLGIGMKADDGKWRMNLVHRLVCLAFHGEQPSKAERVVAHADDNKLNNHYKNLRWATYKENVAEAISNGKMDNHWMYQSDLESRRGENHPAAKITEADVIEIRTSSMKSADLARKFNLKPTTICHIRTNRIWKHVQVPSV